MGRTVVALVGLAALVSPGAASATGGWQTAGRVPGTLGNAGAVSAAPGAPLYLDGFRSTDGGRHWLRPRRPVTARIQAIVPARSAGRTAYALDVHGRLWRTTDAGRDWLRRAAFPSEAVL